MALKCPKTAFLGVYRGYFPMPAISLKIAQNSPVLGVICRVIAKGVKYCQESPQNALKNGRILPIFGVYGKYAMIGVNEGIYH